MFRALNACFWEVTFFNDLNYNCYYCGNSHAWCQLHIDISIKWNLCFGFFKDLKSFNCNWKCFSNLPHLYARLHFSTFNEIQTLSILLQVIKIFHNKIFTSIILVYISSTFYNIWHSFNRLELINRHNVIWTRYRFTRWKQKPV